MSIWMKIWISPIRGCLLTTTTSSRECHLEVIFRILCSFNQNFNWIPFCIDWRINLCVFSFKGYANPYEGRVPLNRRPAASGYFAKSEYSNSLLNLTICVVLLFKLDVIPLVTRENLKKQIISKNSVNPYEDNSQEGRLGFSTLGANLLNAGLFGNLLTPARRPFANLVNRMEACTSPSGDAGHCSSASACTLLSGRPSGSCTLGRVCCISKSTKSKLKLFEYKVLI